jgi:hypothetical protein
MKKFSIWGVLLILSFLTATANAKNLPSISISPKITNDLSDRLEADIDFQEFTVSMYQFLKKIQSSRSENLLTKYSMQTASKEEKQSLSAKFGFSTDETFRAFLVNLYIKGAKLNEKFPELKEFSKYESSIRLAARNVVNSQLKPLVTAEQCWDSYFALTAIWSLYCQQTPDWSTCTIQSYALISTLTIGCLIAAE